MHNGSKRGFHAATFLIGAASGAAAALLISPNTANTVRDKLRNGARNLWNKGGDMMHRGQQEFGQGSGHSGSQESSTSRTGYGTSGTETNRYGSQGSERSTAGSSYGRSS